MMIRTIGRGWKAVVLAAALFGGVAAARAQVQFDGDVRFSMVGSRLHVYIEELENLGPEVTEKLRIRVWANDDHWSESDRGRLLGMARLPRVAANDDKDDLWRKMKLHRPDSDWYYVTVVLEERVVDDTGTVRWEVRDWRESDDRVFIRDTWFPFIPWD